MSDIFREVDEAMQREKAALFWKDYGPTIILSIIVIVLSTAAMTAYRTWDHWRDRQETQKLLTAQESKDLVAAYEEAAKETRKGHEAIALLSAGNAAAESKDFVKASQLYEQAASDNRTPSDLRDLASIFAVRATLLQGANATPDYAALAEKLAPIAKNAKSAFQLQAKLESALLYGDGLKNYKTAIDLLQGFDAESVPGSLQEKANALKHVYELEYSKTPKA